MTMIMTATPLAMLGCGLPGSNVTLVIEWHVVAMFAPSFVTGSLIRRYGAPRIMQIGFMLLLATSPWRFRHRVAALLLGPGVPGRRLELRLCRRHGAATQTYRPSNRCGFRRPTNSRSLALAPSPRFPPDGCKTTYGWMALNLAVVPFLVVALVAARPRSPPSGVGRYSGMTRPVYLDYNATTPVAPEVAEAIRRSSTKNSAIRRRRMRLASGPGQAVSQATTAGRRADRRARRRDRLHRLRDRGQQPGPARRRRTGLGRRSASGRQRGGAPGGDAAGAPPARSAAGSSRSCRSMRRAGFRPTLWRRRCGRTPLWSRSCTPTTKSGRCSRSQRSPR